MPGLFDSSTRRIFCSTVNRRRRSTLVITWILSCDIVIDIGVRICPPGYATCPVENGAAPGRSGDPEKFKRAIAAASDAPLYTLAHALVAALNAREAVTTNYDQLYEMAMHAADRPLSVLPANPRDDGSSWLLKMHGCISSPKSIVITRRDYLRYQGTRSALQGIVQAMLITRHILFIGFSLTDDNFHILIDAVRSALEGDDGARPNRRHFGTALFPSDPGLAGELWKDDLDIVSVSSTIGSSIAASRDVELFLDYLAWQANSSAAHLLDESFAQILNEEDVSIKVSLRDLEDKLSQLDRGGSYEPLCEILRRYGSRLSKASD